MNSPLKWAGGKRWQVDMIAALWDRYDAEDHRLVEPFCGGCSIALGIGTDTALLNDTNPWLINFWQELQTAGAIDVADLPDTYYRNRERFNALTLPKDALDAARLFWYLNQRSFNGLWRVNKDGLFNTPARPGGLKPPVPNCYLEVEAGWHFTCADFELIELQDGDFVYADPPYDDGFTSYGGTRFDWEDQIRLAMWLSTHNGPVVIMNKATPRVQQLYLSLGFQIELIDAPQRMHHSRGRSGDVLEVMATNSVIR